MGGGGSEGRLLSIFGIVGVFGIVAAFFSFFAAFFCSIIGSGVGGGGGGATTPFSFFPESCVSLRLRPPQASHAFSEPPRAHFLELSSHFRPIFRNYRSNCLNYRNCRAAAPAPSSFSIVFFF
jgi:hypothetical protein